MRNVAFSLPLYSMSTFLLPKSISSKMDLCFSYFLWGTSSNGQKRIHMKSLDSLCLPKHFGGLSFRKMFDQNMALISKQA